MFGFNKKSKEDKSGATKNRKGKGYYLEIDESQVAQALNGKQTAKADSEPKPESAKAAAPAPAEAPKAEPVKAAAPAAKSKSEPAKTEAPKAAPVQAAAPAQKEAPVTTFAPNYLLTLSSTDGRRRPGANMSSFLEMARKVKTSR